MGMVTPKNLSKAVYWYKKAANQGSRMSQFNLASMYSNGEGVIKDVSKAEELY